MTKKLWPNFKNCVSRPLALRSDKAALRKSPPGGASVQALQAGTPVPFPVRPRQLGAVVALGVHDLRARYVFRGRWVLMT